MVVTICIGSSCHIKGSREIVRILEQQIALHKLENKVELNGSFCMGQCVKGVCVKIGEDIFSLSPENTNNFFEKEVLGRLKE
ncbi:NAD(P)H-dependent oxidoreductase subunit E [Anaerocolumna sp. AGMB13025]|uniref:(2Fe-2S) ferredoxin domain-containing protein n=1 Tax=Anaerocolumna sp. AGMB13025 TaxID=3039116 RepID=UPI00241CDA91|nr:NAD(P)H-dependent oxidoreductase subunit E [Anaerocolumna sp. AGMB13025]WFR57335.1 NAD(P)H-dependent oxidoreductase subunit E [Anaerocolumna sp. AGMB13025]